MNDGDPSPVSFLEAAGLADRAALAEFEKAACVAHLAPGEVLSLAGQHGDDAYLVTEGVLEVRVDGIVFELMEAGHCLVGRPRFGQGIEPREVMVVAREPTAIVTIPQSALLRLRAAAPSVWRQVHRFFGHQVPSLFLASTELFRGTDVGLIRHCDKTANWLHLHAGDELFRQGDPADALYVVVSGRLEIIHEDGDGTCRAIGSLGRGEVVGEIALLVNSDRTATVQAVRDSDLVRISREDFEQILIRDPEVGIRMARILASRLAEQTKAKHGSRAPARVVAVLAERPLEVAVAEGLATELRSRRRTVALVNSTRIEHQFGEAMAAYGDGEPDVRLRRWLSAQEDRFDLVIYACDDPATPWTKWAVRHADVVLLVLAASGGPAYRDLERATIGAGVRARVELVIVHTSSAVPSGTKAWLDVRSVAAHHHIRLSAPRDIARLSRCLDGTMSGVALSGGGARGFAHIGVLKAMQEWGWDVDYIGGTSMGSVMGAQYAMGMSIEDMIKSSRVAFTSALIGGDLTFPIVSFARGRNMVRAMKQLFGDTCIEDLPIPYFCVSCNLSKACVVVHDKGPLWLWTRTSCALPGISPPVPLQTDLLVDGGVLNNLPADVLRNRMMGLIAAVDVSSDARIQVEMPDETAFLSGWIMLRHYLRYRRTNVPGIMRILARTSTLSSTQNLATVHGHCDLYIRPPVDDVHTFDWNALDKTVEVGYRSTLEQLEAWDRAGRPRGAAEMEHKI